MVMVAQLCEYTKNHWTDHFKWVDFMTCEIISVTMWKKKKDQETLSLEIGDYLYYSFYFIGLKTFWFLYSEVLYFFAMQFLLHISCTVSIDLKTHIVLFLLYRQLLICIFWILKSVTAKFRFFFAKFLLTFLLTCNCSW